MYSKKLLYMHHVCTYVWHQTSDIWHTDTMTSDIRDTDIWHVHTHIWHLTHRHTDNRTATIKERDWLSSAGSKLEDRKQVCWDLLSGQASAPHWGCLHNNNSNHNISISPNANKLFYAQQIFVYQKQKAITSAALHCTRQKLVLTKFPKHGQLLRAHNTPTKKSSTRDLHIDTRFIAYTAC